MRQSHRWGMIGGRVLGVALARPLQFVRGLIEAAVRLVVAVAALHALPLSHSPGWAPPGSDPSGWSYLTCPRCESDLAYRENGSRGPFHCRDCGHRFPAVQCTCSGMALAYDAKRWKCIGRHRGLFIARLCPSCRRLSQGIRPMRYKCEECGEFDVQQCRACGTGFAGARPDGRWVCELNNSTY